MTTCTRYRDIIRGKWSAPQPTNQPTKQTNKQTNKQRNKQTDQPTNQTNKPNKQTNKQPSKQASKQTKPTNQASKQTNKQTNKPNKQTIKFSVGPSVGNAHCFDCVLKADSRALMLSHTVVTCWSLMGQLILYTNNQPTNQPNKPNKQTTSQTSKQANNQPTNQANKPTNQPNKPNKQTTNQPTNQANKPTNQPTNQRAKPTHSRTFSTVAHHFAPQEAGSESNGPAVMDMAARTVRIALPSFATCKHSKLRSLSRELSCYGLPGLKAAKVIQVFVRQLRSDEPSLVPHMFAFPPARTKDMTTRKLEPGRNASSN